MSKQLFKSYPSVNKFHFTEDGQAFEHEHHAQAHAKSLGKESLITTIVREEEIANDEKKDAADKKAAPSKAKK